MSKEEFEESQRQAGKQLESVLFFVTPTVALLNIGSRALRQCMEMPHEQDKLRYAALKCSVANIQTFAAAGCHSCTVSRGQALFELVLNKSCRQFSLDKKVLQRLACGACKRGHKVFMPRYLKTW